MVIKIIFWVCFGVTPSVWGQSTDSSLDINPSLMGLDCIYKIDETVIGYQPLFIEPNSPKFYNPDNSGQIHIPNGKDIELHCQNGFAAPYTKYKMIKPKCKTGKGLEWEKKFHSLYDFRCIEPNTYTARSTSRKCSRDAIIAEIGFEIPKRRFAKTMEVCHHQTFGFTYYSKYELKPFNDRHERGINDGIWSSTMLSKSIDADKRYEEQDKTLVTILGTSKYYDKKKGLFLSKGHLSAKTDHVYEEQQHATFFYINTAPQWQNFNAKNWASIEDGVRKYIAKEKIDADIYTGTYGVSSLKDNKGVWKDLYLDMTDAKAPKIPVPKLYYKVVIDRKSKKGIVLLGINNPHLTLEEIKDKKREYIICDDISYKIKWINWKKTELAAGYSYACSVPDFVENVKDLPELTVSGELGI